MMRPLGNQSSLAGWTQNATGGKRALNIIDDVTKFVKTVKLPKLSSVDTMMEAMSDLLYKAKLTRFLCIAHMRGGFLTAFQSS